MSLPDHDYISIAVQIDCKIFGANAIIEWKTLEEAKEIMRHLCGSLVINLSSKYK